MSAKMVCGLCISGSQVLLVKKLKPSWQSGLLNGVGGKIEDNEAPASAMVREFLEETGHATVTENWRLFAIEREPTGAWVYFYVMQMDQTVKRCTRWPETNDVGEELIWMPTRLIDHGYLRPLGNLHWLVPLAQDPRDIPAVLFEPRGSIEEMATW